LRLILRRVGAQSRSRSRRRSLKPRGSGSNVASPNCASKSSALDLELVDLARSAIAKLKQRADEAAAKDGTCSSKCGVRSGAKS
jgi:hypothetical protein